MKRKHIQLLVGLAVTVFFLWISFGDVKWRDLWKGLREVRYIWAVPFMAVTLLSMFFRTIRWKYLLEPVVKVPARKLFDPIMVCFTLNSILPGRAGEFARAYLVSKDYKAPFSATLATVIVERIVDGLSLLAFFVAIIAFMGLGQGAMEWKGYTINAETLQQLSKKLLVFCIVLLAGTLLMLWGPFHRLVLRVIRGVPFVPVKLKTGLARFIESLVQGFYSLKSFRIVFWVVFHTITVWVTVGWSLVLMSYGFPGLTMTFMQGMATSIIICIAILIPAAPGYWGLYEVGTIVALMMLGIVPVDAKGAPMPEGKALALSYALVAHFIQMIPILLLGFYYLWRRQVRISDITSAEEEQESENGDLSRDAGTEGQNETFGAPKQNG
jgi:hypothetical protein